MTLNDLIRIVSEEFPDADPRKLAELVAERTEPGDLYGFYVTALEPLVYDRIRLHRNYTMNSKQGRSPKLDDRRSWWARMLTQRVHVGESQWKMLGDCGPEDLEFCIGERRQQIGKLEGQVAKFETILQAVLTNGVDTVGDLPAGAVEL